MPTTSAKPVQAKPAEELERHYLAALRGRFKAEVNRLTGGAMRELLGLDPEAADLSFLLSYVYAFEWLRRDVDPRHRAAVVAPFRTGGRAFLMDLLAQTEDVGAFVRATVDHLLAIPDESLRERQQVLRLLDERRRRPRLIAPIKMAKAQPGQIPCLRMPRNSDTGLPFPLSSAGRNWRI